VIFFDMADTTTPGVKQSPVARMITKVVVLANVVAIFGKDLGELPVTVHTTLPEAVAKQ
jgi:hypothetical protein